MAFIQKMDHKLSNMIAAGEVVDRPSSVIKELVENALDAHATKINIEVVGFGMEKMTVTDNGDGMDETDAKLAFERYATSKIKSEMDLSHIHTFGFRGEALAAISAVSKVVLRTKTKNALGYEVIYEGGQFISSQEAAANEGTQIEVSNLFFNTPARFKYIKSEYTEKYAIIDIFDRLALANPHVYMQLSFDQKLYKETYGNGDFQQLIDQIYGKHMTKGLTIASHDVQHIHINAYLLSPNIVRSRKKDISVFINHRYIKNYRYVSYTHPEPTRPLYMTNAVLSKKKR
jgi:DNA mismatch repair protein MutL